MGAGAATGGQFAPPGSQPAAAKKPPGANQQKKAALAARIKALRKILSELEHNQITARQAQRAATAAATGKAVVHRKSASSTPAKKGAAATSAKQAKAGAPAGKAAARGHVLTAKEAVALITQMIATLTTQIRQLANEGEAIELVFDINQPRDRRGRWMNAPGGMDTPNMRLAERAGLVEALGMQQRRERQGRFAYDGRPGDMGHIRAIMAAADNMRDNSTASTALHNAGRALAGRDMKSVRVHLSVAERETRGTGNNAIVKSIRRSMQGVPTGTYERLPYGSGLAPKSLRARHRRNPGYYPSPTATWSNVDDAIELAFRYKHGWIKLEASKVGRSFRNAAGVMGGGYPGMKGKLGVKYEPGSAARAMVGSHVSHREARGLENLFAPKGSGKGVHVSKQATRNEAITGVKSIPGPFGKHLSKSEARGFTGLFGGDTRKQKLYGKLRKGGPQHNKAKAVLAQARSKQVQMATELAGPQRFKHGWVPIGEPKEKDFSPPEQPGGEKSPFYSRTHTPAGAVHAWHGSLPAAKRGSGSVAAKYRQRVDVYRRAESNMATELSAQTGRLSVTPAPRGKPGGPGLYDVKGMGHTPYLQQIVKALIEKRGMPESKAYAIARAAIRRWSAGGGHVHPEVRAAAGKAESGELEKQARARAKAA